MPQFRPLKTLLSLALATFIVLGLGGCRSSAEKAADLVTEGAAQQQAGALDAAQESYRGALALDPENLDALRGLASISLGREDFVAARAQYTALRERQSEDVDANLALAEIALADHDIEQAAALVAVPRRADPANPRTRGILAALAFHGAADDAARDKALASAREILAEAPGVLSARRVLIQALMSGPDADAALAAIDAGMKEHSHSLELNMMKLNVLSRKGDGGDIDQLKAMYRDFPDNRDIQSWLSDWYLGEGEPRETVAFLRDLAARHGDDLRDHERIADYVEGHFAPRDAIGQLDTLAGSSAQGPLADLYRAAAAGLRFDLGERAAALAVMQELAGGSRTGSARAEDRYALARMLDGEGNRTEARAILDEVLAFNPNLVEGQKLRARWLMQDRDYSGAISALRVALTSASRDPELLTMIADAYEQSGAVELAGASLAQAVELSGSGQRESLLFARFLLRNDNRPVAVSVLRNALEVNPDDPELLSLAREVGIEPGPGSAN